MKKEYDLKKLKKRPKKTKLGQEIIRALKECIEYMETQDRVPALTYLHALSALDAAKKLKT